MQSFKWGHPEEWKKKLFNYLSNIISCKFQVTFDFSVFDGIRRNPHWIIWSTWTTCNARVVSLVQVQRIFLASVKCYTAGTHFTVGIRTFGTIGITRGRFYTLRGFMLPILERNFIHRRYLRKRRFWLNSFGFGSCGTSAGYRFGLLRLQFRIGQPWRSSSVWFRFVLNINSFITGFVIGVYGTSMNHTMQRVNVICFRLQTFSFSGFSFGLVWTPLFQHFLSRLVLMLSLPTSQSWTNIVFVRGSLKFEHAWFGALN